MQDITSNSEFENLISNGVTLVDFWAQWCTSCRQLAPSLEGLENIEIIKVDVDEVSDLAVKYQIQNLPTLILFKDGKELDRKTGFHSVKELQDWVLTIK